MRTVTATSNIANLVIDFSGRGWLKFNDKLKDGRRSLKVLGWEYRDYKLARNLLLIHGHHAKIIEHSGYSNRGGRSYSQYRLHVRENS